MAEPPDREFDLRIPGVITDDNVSEVLGTLRSAQHVGENVREQVLAAYSPGRGAFPHGINRPVTTIAENLAVAAMKLNMSRLETAQGRQDPALPGLIARYNEAAAAFSDMWGLVQREDWTTVKARYGSVRRDAVPRSCLSLIPALLLAAVRRS